MHISIPSHLTFPATTNLLLQDGRRLASIRGAQWGPGCARVKTSALLKRIVPGLLYAHIHRSEYCVGGHSTMSILR